MLVGGGLSLGKRGTLRFQKATGLVTSYLYPLTSAAPCLPACVKLQAMMIMVEPSETVSKSPVKCFLLYVALVMMSLHSNTKVTKTLMKRYLNNVHLEVCVQRVFKILILKYRILLLTKRKHFGIYSISSLNCTSDLIILFYLIGKLQNILLAKFYFNLFSAIN